MKSFEYKVGGEQNRIGIRKILSYNRSHVLVLDYELLTPSQCIFLDRRILKSIRSHCGLKTQDRTITEKRWGALLDGPSGCSDSRHQPIASDL